MLWVKTTLLIVPQEAYFPPNFSTITFGGVDHHGPSKWPRNYLPANVTHEEANELNTITTCTLAVIEDPLIPVDRFSSFNLYKRVTALIIQFIHNWKARVQATQPKSGPLTTDELNLGTN